MCACPAVIVLSHWYNRAALDPGSGRHALLGDLMSSDRKYPAPGSWSDQTVPVLPAEGCPAWCDGQHPADGRDAPFHARIVAERDGASVALSCTEYRDPAQTDSTAIILKVDAEAEPMELAENDAIRMVGTLQGEAGRPSWLIVALRSALDMLDPGAGWARPLPGARAGTSAQA
jgi:hypothetical protein